MIMIVGGIGHGYASDGYVDNTPWFSRLAYSITMNHLSVLQSNSLSLTEAIVMRLNWLSFQPSTVGLLFSIFAGLNISQGVCRTHSSFDL